jgi:hypothetical protein
MDISHAVFDLDDGSSVFAKHGSGETLPFLEAEVVVYESVRGSCVPGYVGVDRNDSDDSVTLVLEDLSTAQWPPAWDELLVAKAWSALVSIHEMTPPDALQALPPMDATRAPTWSKALARRDTACPALRLPEAWLRAHATTLGELAAQAQFDPAALVHGDAHGGNVCGLRERAVWVDWSSAHVGHPDEDFGLFAVSVAADGGPVLPLEHGTLAHVAFDAASWVARAGQPAPAWGPGMKRIEAHLWQGALRILVAAGVVEAPSRRA